ncbi:MAG: hypothetical protein KAR42_12580 [candidate division Zixibacteria bacterium]|nr:hypothetical protein [candidate division Zixibacteria bacterium]
MTGKRIFWILPIMLLFLSGFGYSDMMYSADEPDTGLKGNSFVDIVFHDGIIWLASGRGLSYTDDFGQTWYTHNKTTGLNSDDPSAIFGRGQQFWVAGTHTELYGGINYPFGDGIDLTFDGGANWEYLDPLETANFGQLVYDIAGNSQSVYAACFHGGLIVTHNNGQTWSHMFYSPADSSDWTADNWVNLASGRYYSCAVDSFHADSLFVYGGAARGVNKFIYIPRRVKMGGNNVTAIDGDEYLYIAHENGISQADSALTKFYTASYQNGLPVNGWTRKIINFGGKILAGLADKTDSSGLGLYTVADAGAEWTVMAESTTGPSDLWTKTMTTVFEGPGAGLYDFKILNDSVLYAAVGDSGIYQSLDSGVTWQRFYIDSTDMSQLSLRNQVLSVDATADSLYLGTRAGLIKAAYSQPFAIDFDTLITFPEDDSTGSMVTHVRHFEGDTVFTWVAVAPHPDSTGGNYAAIQLISSPILNNPPLVIWAIYSTPPTIINDILVIDSFTTAFATTSGLFGNRNRNIPVMTTFAYSPNDSVSGLTLANYRFNTVNSINGSIFAGSGGGFGKRLNDENFKVVRANTNHLTHDLAIPHTFQNSGLPGDWVIALEMQETSNDTLLWAACRNVIDTIPQSNAVGYSRDFGASWTKVLNGEMVWNFAFDDNGGAYAAASNGLFYSAGSPDTWERAQIIDQNTMDTVWAETEVYSVEVVDSILWVGTSFGLAFRPLDNLSDWSIIRVFKETDSIDDIYAAPVPFSPLAPNGRLTLHYRVEETADITIEVYDFAMNLVKTVVVNKYRPGGEDYFESWDGYNEDGDVVATGMYFFKITYSTGPVRWGRLAIIP